MADLDHLVSLFAKAILQLKIERSPLTENPKSIKN